MGDGEGGLPPACGSALALAGGEHDECLSPVPWDGA